MELLNRLFFLTAAQSHDEAELLVNRLAEYEGCVRRAETDTKMLFPFDF
jgi:hypothetical protein